jgi:hypothetical protein
MGPRKHDNDDGGGGNYNDNNEDDVMCVCCRNYGYISLKIPLASKFL